MNNKLADKRLRAIQRRQADIERMNKNINYHKDKVIEIQQILNREVKELFDDIKRKG